VIGKVGRRYRVASSARHRDGRFVSNLSGCCMRSDCRFLCGTGGDLASGPRPSNFDCPSRSIIGTARLKERQHMFRTIRGPCRQEPVLAKIQRPTAMDCNKAPVSHMRPPSPNY
jgi:hypothetical protein